MKGDPLKTNAFSLRNGWNILQFYENCLTTRYMKSFLQKFPQNCPWKFPSIVSEIVFEIVPEIVPQIDHKYLICYKWQQKLLAYKYARSCA